MSHLDFLDIPANFAASQAIDRLRKIGEENIAATNQQTPVYRELLIHEVVVILERTGEGLPALLPDSVQQLAQQEQRTANPLALNAIARFCNPGIAEDLKRSAKDQLVASSIAVAELEFANALGTRQALALAAFAIGASGMKNEDDPPPRYSSVLCGLDDYPAFCAYAASIAADRVRRIHRGEMPFKADKVFTTVEARVLYRIFYFALDAGDLNVLKHLDPLLPLSAFAPTTARTAPSQSATIALAHAIERLPSPDSIAVLRKTLTLVRHAGVKKKLVRALRNAERRLARRPDLIFLLPTDKPISKSLLTSVRRSIENMYRAPTAMAWQDWRNRFTVREQVRQMAEKLIWHVCDESGRVGFSAVPVTTRAGVVWRCLGGAERSAADGQTITLWHPVVASDRERQCWRDFVANEGIEQPFPQAFRQHYRLEGTELAANTTSLFADHKIAAKPLLGAAGSEGWVVHYGMLALPWPNGAGFEFDIGTQGYPGSDGDGLTGRVQISRLREFRYRPNSWAELDPVAVSEVLRSIDLLVTVGAIAYDPTTARRQMEAWNPALAQRIYLGSQSAQMRLEALRRIYGEASSEVRIAGRHLVVRDHLIHIATGRVTRDGDPVEIEAPEPLGSVSLLPFRDEIMLGIVKTVHAITRTSG